MENENSKTKGVAKSPQNGDKNFFNEFEYNDDDNEMKDVMEIMKI